MGSPLSTTTSLQPPGRVFREITKDVGSRHVASRRALREECRYFTLRHLDVS